MLSKAVAGYTALIALLLYSFFLYQFCYLADSNIASNEEIRNRWNGAIKNKKSASHYMKDVGKFEKFCHFMYGPMPESRLQKFCRLINLQA